MGWIVFGCIMAAVVLFFAVIIVRTVMFKPLPEPELLEQKVEIDRDKVVRDMVDMIRCKTVSNRDEALVDRSEFTKFQELLKERFPRVHQACTLEHIGKTGLLYCLKGESDQAPSVCMAHYDVVPVNEEGWTKPAFEGMIEEDCIWGRGTLDTKGTLCGLLEAAEQLLSQGYIPKNDLYFSFSGEEEIDGDSCADIVAWLEEHQIKPALVVDEGGAVVDHVFPGVD